MEKKDVRLVIRTSDYSMFVRSEDNRATNLEAHTRLRRSMQKNGFLSSFPIVCKKERGKLVIKDGQHRLAIAESMDLPVWYIEEEVDFDIADINCTPKAWYPIDFAQRYAKKIKDYQEGIDFSEAHGISIGTSFALLAGTVNFNNIYELFTTGQFRIKDRPWAEQVINLYEEMCEMAPERGMLSTAIFLQSCMAICRVESFDANRLIVGTRRFISKVGSPKLLDCYPKRDNYLRALQELYNYGKKDLFPLEIEAKNALRKRNVASRAKERKLGGSV